MKIVIRGDFKDEKPSKHCSVIIVELFNKIGGSMRINGEMINIAVGTYRTISADNTKSLEHIMNRVLQEVFSLIDSNKSKCTEHIFGEFGNYEQDMSCLIRYCKICSAEHIVGRSYQLNQKTGGKRKKLK